MSVYHSRKDGCWKSTHSVTNDRECAISITGWPAFLIKSRFDSIFAILGECVAYPRKCLCWNGSPKEYRLSIYKGFHGCRYVVTFRCPTTTTIRDSHVVSSNKRTFVYACCTYTTYYMLVISTHVGLLSGKQPTAMTSTFCAIVSTLRVAFLV